MNTVLSNYGQLCGCPEILKKSCNFFVVGLTYGCRRSWMRIRGIPAFSAPRSIFPRSRLSIKVNTRSGDFIPYILPVYVRISCMMTGGIVIHLTLFSVLGGPVLCVSW